MSSNVVAAAMTGMPMFSAEATVEVTMEVDITDIDNQLADIAAELGVDILLSELTEQ